MRHNLPVHMLWLIVILVLFNVGAGSSKPQEDGSRERLAEAEIALLRVELDEVRASLAAVEDKVQFITIEAGAMNGTSGPHMLITGCNLHLRSGSGTTDDGIAEKENEADNLGKYKGLGNLIVGYNDGAVGVSDRQGSHNVVIGPRHKFSSVGGLVAGETNTVSGRWCSVSGGQQNSALGKHATVSGGRSNVASGIFANVLGGFGNTASGDVSTVSGGINNKATGEGSNVSYGRDITFDTNVRIPSEIRDRILPTPRER